MRRWKLSEFARISQRLFSSTRPRPLDARYFSAFPSAPIPRSRIPLTGHFRTSLLNPFRSRRLNSSKSTTPTAPTDDANLSLSQKLKKLSREYGWSALGVYFLLSVVDFPLCFLAVGMLGTERIGHWEHVAIQAVKNAVGKVIRDPRKVKESVEELATEGDVAGDAASREGLWGWQGQVDKARAENEGEKATIWTKLALAYAVHKSLIFIRVPLTAAVTPKVVKTLRKWGWDIGKRRPKVSTD